MRYTKEMVIGSVEEFTERAEAYRAKRNALYAAWIAGIVFVVAVVLAARWVIDLKYLMI